MLHLLRFCSLVKPVVKYSEGYFEICPIFWFCFYFIKSVTVSQDFVPLGIFLFLSYDLIVT